METITKEEVDNLGEKSLLLGCSGTTSYIFKLENGIRYKQYKVPFDELEELYTLVESSIPLREALSRQTEIKDTKLISFPKSIVLEGDKIIGHIGKFELGTRIDHINPNLEVEYLIDFLKELEYDIEILKYYQCVITDLHPGNVLYNGSIRLIDTDFYKFYSRGEKTPEEIKKENDIEISKIIIYSLMPKAQRSRLIKHKFNTLVKKATTGEITIVEFIEELIDALENKGLQVNDIRTLRKAVLK